MITAKFTLKKHHKENTLVKTESNRLSLQEGYRLAEYEILEVIGRGGFGITYLAKDIHIGKIFAIKELMPPSLSARVEGSTVVPHQGEEEAQFAYIKKKFIEGAKVLAQIRHPNIVEVYRLLEDNGTVYMVMEYIGGEDLKHIIDASPNKQYSEIEIRDVFQGILEGMKKVHSLGVIHRDIKPDNIRITEDGIPKLIDFGAIRILESEEQIIHGEYSDAAFMAKGYTPVEQYDIESKQGFYTDIYALGASMYRMLEKTPPPEATTRLINDRKRSLLGRHQQCSEKFLEAVDHALKLKPEDRPQTIKTWAESLGWNQPKVEPQQAPPLRSPTKKSNKLVLSLCLICSVAVMTGYFIRQNIDSDKSKNDRATQSQIEREQKENHLPLIKREQNKNILADYGVDSSFAYDLESSDLRKCWVLSKKGIVRFEDSNGDGSIDTTTLFASTETWKILKDYAPADKVIVKNISSNTLEVSVIRDQKGYILTDTNGDGRADRGTPLANSIENEEIDRSLEIDRSFDEIELTITRAPHKIPADFFTRHNRNAIKHAAETGNPKAQWVWGMLHSNHVGLINDPKACLTWVEKSAQQGFARAQYSLARIYESAEDEERDMELSFQWMKKSAMQGCVFAEYGLASFYYIGEGVQKDISKSIFWLEIAAQRGFDNAQYDLGQMYRLGKGKKQSDKAAFNWYKKAAKQRHTLAMASIGWMYENGKGTDLDLKEAQKWYTKSADQGHSQSQYNLGCMYLEGKGIAQDYAKALELFHLSANQSYRYAYENLAKMYSNGWGVEKNEIEARKWRLKRATSQAE